MDEEVESPAGDSQRPLRSPVSAGIRHGLVVLSSLALILAALGGALWILPESTWSYSYQKLDSDTTNRLRELKAELMVVGASPAVVSRLSAAAQAGTYLGDAVDALADTERALQPASASPAVAQVQEKVRAAYRELYGKQYGGSAAGAAPIPTYMVPFSSAPLPPPD